MAKAAKTAKSAGKANAKTKADVNAKKPSAARGGRDGRRLVVVESPAKAKTINKYLGSGYVVKASMGHVRDLPSREMGVDLENNFKPTYEPLTSRRKVLAELKKLARSAPEVFLATDLDREGEAIAWHLAESLGVPEENVRRVIFNEITAGAIKEAFANPRNIDMNKVNAQQARRILDRIVGYKISPLLWKKVARGLSAGRVQSVAVRLIVERQREIDAFIPEEYWKIAGVFTADMSAAKKLSAEWAAFLAQRDDEGNSPTLAAQQEFLSAHNAFQAELVKLGGKRFKETGADATIDIARAIGLKVSEVRRLDDPNGKGPAAHRVIVVGTPAANAPSYKVTAIQRRDSKSHPPAPFTTATLQQAAAVQLRFSASRTMRIAQQLYEGVEVPGEGSVGLITYMRTDSRHLSADALSAIRKLIVSRFGDAYLPEKPNFFSSGKRAQEAHEAIRPSDFGRTPEDLRGSLSDEQYKLYSLIWKRTVACQMPPATWLVTEADITVNGSCGEAVFKAIGRTLAFDGFMQVAGVPKGGEQILPKLDEGQSVAPIQIDPTQHFTQPPPRYTEASLVKALEAEGIGRPSTYASIIKTIQDRQYVEQRNRSFYPTDLGNVVTDKLVKHFPKVFDIRFTAFMEDELDKIEEAAAEWTSVLHEFYDPFAQNLERAGDEMVHAKAEEEPSDYTCEKCGKPMVYKFSRNGRYLACSGYPDCKNTFPVDKHGRPQKPQQTDIACPKCGSPMMIRKGKFGPFMSCPKYPECDGVLNLDRKGCVKLPSAPPLEVDLPCPKCSSKLYLRRGKRGPWLSCSKYPKCRGRVGWKTLTEDQQKQLELELMNHEKAHPVAVVKKLDGSEVPEDYAPQVGEIGESNDDTGDDI